MRERDRGPVLQSATTWLKEVDLNRYLGNHALAFSIATQIASRGS